MHALVRPSRLRFPPVFRREIFSQERTWRCVYVAAKSERATASTETTALQTKRVWRAIIDGECRRCIALYSVVGRRMTVSYLPRELSRLSIAITRVTSTTNKPNLPSPLCLLRLWISFLFWNISFSLALSTRDTPTNPLGVSRQETHAPREKYGDSQPFSSLKGCARLSTLPFLRLSPNVDSSYLSLSLSLCVGMFPDTVQTDLRCTSVSPLRPRMHLFNKEIQLRKRTVSNLEKR